MYGAVHPTQQGQLNILLGGMSTEDFCKPLYGELFKKEQCISFILKRIRAIWLTK
jgi:hypothetical protein